MRADACGLYIHIPFCVRKCPYCDFNTYPVARDAVRDFLRALEQELRLIAAAYRPGPLDTLYIGGGTPTVLRGEQLADVVGWVRELFGLAPGAEVTVEANPGSVTPSGLRAMAACGVTRISMGVQSFSDEMLRRIGRNHSVSDVYRSYALIREAGIPSVNFDLMFALPGQTVADWQNTLARALELAPEHLSCYSLIIEEGTPFGELHRAGKLPLPPEEDEAAMYEHTVAACVAAGYEHYEVSNFARPGHRCRHNELYWRNLAWLAAGPGAHGYWQGTRYWNVRELGAYIEAVGAGRLPVAGCEPRRLDEQMDETMMLGLRLTEGVSAADFAARFGVRPEEVYGPAIQRLTDWGLLELADGHVRLTPRGRMLCNRVVAEFLRTA